MFLRMYNTSDCEYLAELFYQIVHNVNAKDYTKEQLDVWPIVCEIFCDINPMFLLLFPPHYYSSNLF